MPRRWIYIPLALILGLLALVLLSPQGSLPRRLLLREPSLSSQAKTKSDSNSQPPTKTARTQNRPKPTIEETGQLLRDTIIAKVDLDEATLEEATTALNLLLRNAGVSPHDLRITVHPALYNDERFTFSELRLRNVPVATVLQYMMGRRGIRYRVGEGTVEISSASSFDEDQRLFIQKLDNIIIPALDFDNTTVEEAIDFLRQRSRELDPDREPTQRGISYVVRKTRQPDPTLGAEISQPNSTPPHLLTFRAENISLTEALNQITSQTGLQWCIDEFAISIYPVDPNDPFR